MDFIMLSLYLATFSLRSVAYVLIESNQYGLREMPRKDWPSMDPTLIAEGLFAVANAFSFSRIIFLFQANQHLGPIQISLGCMLIDIVKFLFIFLIVMTSFVCGLNQLYYYYNGSRTQTTADSFYSQVYLHYCLFLVIKRIRSKIAFAGLLNKDYYVALCASCPVSNSDSSMLKTTSLRLLLLFSG